jgi:hypothetical protein
MSAACNIDDALLCKNIYVKRVLADEFKTLGLKACSRFCCTFGL